MKKEIIKIAITSILFIIGLLANFENETINNIIFIISYIIIGAEIVIEAIKNIFHGEIFDENFLMTIATIGALAIGEYPEAVAVMLFYEIGELFQESAIEKSRKSIESLASIRADYANLKIGDNIEKVEPKQVKVGDVIIIKPGEKIPLDGKVVEGTTSLDTSALTGESLPRDVKIGDTVLSGCININGVITVKVEKEFGESTVSKILDLVENEDSKKSKSEKFITKFAKYYTPIVVILALIIAIIPPIILKGNFVEWINRAFTFLVISCPCALVISVPLSFFGGIGGASKKGVLIKGSTYIEDLANAEVVVFDKTGTLTKGVFEVTKVVIYDKNELNMENSFNSENENIIDSHIQNQANNSNSRKTINNNTTKEELIELAAYAESNSNHPIAKSILKEYGKEIDYNSITSIEEISGLGIIAEIYEDEVIIGNSKIMEKFNIKYVEAQEIGTIVYIAINKKYSGYIVISDVIKSDSKSAIEQLKKNKIKQTIMLTGDLKKVASAVSEELGIDKFYAELLPNEKAEIMNKIMKNNSGNKYKNRTEQVDKNETRNKSKKGKVVFVGDGINDSPVLSLSDIGIAMGGIGSDAAIEAADVVIMNDEPSKIVDAIKISRKTLKIVKQNIVFAIGIKILVLILGALGIANMWEAVFADVGVSIIAVLNALRALK